MGYPSYNTPAGASFLQHPGLLEVSSVEKFGNLARGQVKAGRVVNAPSVSWYDPSSDGRTLVFSGVVMTADLAAAFNKAGETGGDVTYSEQFTTVPQNAITATDYKERHGYAGKAIKFLAAEEMQSQNFGTKTYTLTFFFDKTSNLVDVSQTEEEANNATEATFRQELITASA